MCWNFGRGTESPTTKLTVDFLRSLARKAKDSENRAARQKAAKILAEKMEDIEKDIQALAEAGCTSAELRMGCAVDTFLIQEFERAFPGFKCYATPYGVGRVVLSWKEPESVEF